MGAVHQRVDLERWVREFPLSRQRAEVRELIARWNREQPGCYPDQAAQDSHAKLMDPAGDAVVGPRQIATVEQLRTEAGGSLGPGVPVDVMVWAKGEPPHRAATKMGGLPYRPRTAPWPAGDEGPSMFLGQICFADSLDVLPKKARRLPGDVLLVFVPRADGVWDSDDEDPGALQLEWWPLGTEDLVTSRDLPPMRWGATRGGGLEPCYAQLHRSYDYPETPADHPIRRCNGAGQLCVFEGGKVGGVAFPIQEGRPCRGEFLCSLGSIHPTGEHWPLLNVERNPDGEFEMKGDFLMFGDVGTLYFGISAAGLLNRKPRVHWGMEMY